VRVVNFVAQGTIEEGMLSILKFKKSLFAGALDGGEKEVFLGGTRLNRFIQGVEKATSSIPQPEAQAPPDESDGGADVGDGDDRQADPRGDGRGDGRGNDGDGQSPSTPTAHPAAAGAVDPWSGLLQQLALAAHPPSKPTAATTAPHGLSLVHRDQRSGENYLKIPVPAPEVLDRVLSAVATLLERFKK
jgi:hypothetical protein